MQGFMKQLDPDQQSEYIQKLKTELDIPGKIHPFELS